MKSWSPISREELDALVAKELAGCEPEQLSAFSAYRTPVRAVAIDRFGSKESVFVVAQRGNVVVYYEDVEEGFNLSSLASDGSIATPGAEQWELKHAISRLAA